jgi:hypothetical protein
MDCALWAANPAGASRKGASMSIQFLRVEGSDWKEHDKDVQTMLNDGFQVVSNHITYVHHEAEYDRVLYTTYLQRGTIDGTVNKASVMEAMERRIRRVERLIKQIESLMQGSIDDEAVPTAWLEDQMQLYKTVKMAGNSQFIPLGDIYAEVLAEADAEDALREGNRG